MRFIDYHRSKKKKKNTNSREKFIVYSYIIILRYVEYRFLLTRENFFDRTESLEFHHKLLSIEEHDWASSQQIHQLYFHTFLSYF